MLTFIWLGSSEVLVLRFSKSLTSLTMGKKCQSFHELGFWTTTSGFGQIKATVTYRQYLVYRECLS